MRIYWEEPWSVKLVKARHKSNRCDLAGVWRVSIIGAPIVLAILVAVRYLVPGTDDVLTWEFVSVAFLSALFLWAIVAYLACLPTRIHLTEKGIIFHTALFKYDELTSISIEDRDGFHLLVVRRKNRKGKEIERTAVTSPKVPDEDVFRFLADIGQAHLCHSA